MIRIGEFARLCNTTIKTLRYYDEICLLKPINIDVYSNYRYYDMDQLKDFYRIANLKELGFSLEEIVNFEDKDTFSKKEQYFKEIEELKTKIEELNKFDNKYNVVIKTNPGQTYYGFRKLFKSRDELKEYENIEGIINFDLSEKSTDLDLELLFLSKPTIPDQNLKERCFDKTELVASIVLDKNDITKGYQELIRYINSYNYSISGSFVEFFLDEDLCEIIVPIKSQNQGEITMKKFINDERVIGKWDVIDLLYNKEQFNMKSRKFDGELPYNEIYFLPEGEKYWVISWTKGYLKLGNDIPNKYEIEEINGENYMFVDATPAFKTNTILVLKQVNNKKYTKEEIRIKDNMDYEFILNQEMVGYWKSVDFVSNIEDFDPSKKNIDELCLTSLEFKEDGTIIWNDKYDHNKWSDTKVYISKEAKVSRCEIRIIDGTKYMFFEWKSGDYSYGKKNPKYYVLKSYLR